MKQQKFISLLTAFLLAFGVLTACTKTPIEQPPAGISIQTYATDAIITTETVTTTTVDTSLEETELSDIIEPVVEIPKWDYDTLSNESIGWGQGVHFDELNRPHEAIRVNTEYEKYKIAAIENTEEKVITLTFDQGYENGFTAPILDVLKEKGVQATFFLVQSYVNNNSELVQRMVDEGHVLGNHSVHHYSMPDLTNEEVEQEIMALHEDVLIKYGVCMNRFRPPEGKYSERVLAITGDLGYTTYLWSFAYADWDPNDQPDPEKALQKLIERAHPGAIYLLHSVSKTNSEILGDFIDAMREQGYIFR